MPVLYGVFLYMGTASLDGLQFYNRILLIFMPKKYQVSSQIRNQCKIFIGQKHMDIIGLCFSAGLSFFA